jgi:hypothetical protein
MAMDKMIVLKDSGKKQRIALLRSIKLSSGIDKLSMSKISVELKDKLRILREGWKKWEVTLLADSDNFSQSMLKSTKIAKNQEITLIYWANKTTCSREKSKDISHQSPTTKLKSRDASNLQMKP